MPNSNCDELPGTPSPGLSPPWWWLQRRGRGPGAALRWGRSGGILLLSRCWEHGGRSVPSNAPKCSRPMFWATWQIPSAFKMPSKYAPNQKLTRWFHDLSKKHCKMPDPKQRAQKTAIPNYYTLKQCANGTRLHLKLCWSKNKKANKF